jgi:Glycosyl hydrolases family 16
MRPPFEPSPRRSARGVAALLLPAVPMLAAVACAPADAVVGAVPLVADASAADVSTVLFSSELAAKGGTWDDFTPLDGERVTYGVANAGARDGLVAELRFPGDPALGPTDDASPDLNAGISTRQYFRYGTFRARVQFASCAPTEEIASAAFMFFNDGHDDNGNGIVDNPELDFHVLGGTPSFIVLTAWSDYEVANGAETFLKVSHAVDTATGDTYDTLAPGDATYTKTGNAPELAQAGFPAPGAFYEIGIEWQPKYVRFFIVRDGVEVRLWTLTDPAFVPQAPLPLMFDLWHPATHWLPTRASADYPAHDAVMLVDWAAWTSP